MIEIRRGSMAFFTFERNISEIRSLLQIMGKDKDTLRRAAIILLVTAFETFVEDKLKASFINRIEKISKPTEISSLFNDIIIGWLYNQRKQRQPSEIYKLTGAQWKSILIDSFEKEIKNLNTPDSKTLNLFYKKIFRC